MADRRIEILEATCKVIGRNGIHDLRVEDVAKEVGVSPALVYYYFDTRADLLARAFEFADNRSTAHTRKQMDLEASGRRQIEDILFHEFDEAPDVHDNWVIWSEMGAAAVFDKDLLGSVEKWSEHWVKIVANLIRAGHKDGSISRDVVPNDAGERLTAVVDGLGTKLMLGIMSQDRVRKLVRDAIETELGPPPG